MLLDRLGDCPVTGGVTLVPGQGHQPVTAEKPNYEETPWEAHDAARPTLSEEQKSEQGQNGYRDRDVAKLQSHFESHQITQVVAKWVLGQDT